MKRVALIMLATTAGIVKKGGKVLKKLFGHQGAAIKRNSYFYKMYCPDCHRFIQVTNTGLPCKVCGSASITLAHNWKPDLIVMQGGQINE